MTSPRESSRPATYELHFEHVTPDGAAVRTAYERETRTSVPETEVLEVLTRFASIDALQTIDVEPQITLRAPALILQVRPYRGRLLACDPAAAERVWRELTLEDLAHALRAGTLTSASGSRAPVEAESEAAPPAQRSHRWPRVLLAVGLALNAYAIASLFMARPAPDFVPSENGQPPRSLLSTMSGSYAAPPPAHVERIELRPPNIVIFHGSEGLPDRTDTYLYGSYKNRPRLLTGSHGFIDLLEAHSLEFQGRRYERAASVR